GGGSARCRSASRHHAPSARATSAATPRRRVVARPGCARPSTRAAWHAGALPGAMVPARRRSAASHPRRTRQTTAERYRSGQAMSTHDPLGAPPHGAPQQDSTAQGPGPYPPPPPPPASRKEAKAAAKAARAHAKALRPWYRKKRWWAVGALVLVIGVAAVAGGGADEADDEPAAPASDPAATQPAEGAPGEAAPAPAGSSAGDQEVHAVGQWAHTGDFDVTVHQVQDPYTPSNQFETPQPGHRFVAVEVEVRNTADDARTISTLLGAEVTDSMNRPWHV